MAMLLIPLSAGAFSDTADFNKQITAAARQNPTLLYLQSLIALQAETLAELKKIRCKIEPIEDDCYPPQEPNQ